MLYYVLYVELSGSFNLHYILMWRGFTCCFYEQWIVYMSPYEHMLKTGKVGKELRMSSMCLKRFSNNGNSYWT